MYKIAFDLNGGDKALNEKLNACVKFIQNNHNFKIVLVGPQDQILAFFNQKLPSNFEIIDNHLTSSNPKNLRLSLHEQTSMNQTLKLLADKKVDAVLSAGDSGLYLSAATFIVKRLDNISRAAFMAIFPTIIKNNQLLFLDAGANVETKEEFIYDWARIGNVFAQKAYKKVNPRIGLINIGTENYKGNEIIQKADKLLKENSKLNYLGFIESRNLLEGEIDIALVDGYGGNLVVKSYEGAINSFKNLLKKTIKKSFIRKIAYLFMKKGFKEAAETLDYRNIGAAWVIGLNGLVAKAHGASDEKAFLGALYQIKLAIENDVLSLIKAELGINE